MNYSLSAIQRHQQLPIIDTGNSQHPLEVDLDRVQHLRQQAQRLEAAIEAAGEEAKRRHESYLTSQHIVNITRRWLDQLPDGTPLSSAPAIKLDNGDHKRVLEAVRRQRLDLVTSSRRCRRPSSPSRI